MPASTSCTKSPAGDDEPGLYTTRQAADYLNVSYDWLKKRASAAEVPHTRIGRSVRFSREHLDEIVRSGEQRVLTMSTQARPRRRRSSVAPR